MSESSQIEVRTEMIARTTAAIVEVRELVSQLNQREKDQLHHHSPEYRKLVDTIRDWYRPKPVMPPPLSAAEVAELEAEESEVDETPVIDAIPDVSGDGKKPMAPYDLLRWLREDFEDHLDTGGETWWVKELAERLEIPELTLLDRDHDAGLLFELKEDGHLSYHWLERNKDEFDYLVGLNGGRIEWD